MKRAIPIVLLVVVAVAGFLIYRAWFSRKQADDALKLSGNIEAHESLVSFKISGRIVELPVEEGQNVQAGRLLARLDDDDYRQDVAVSEAAARVRDRQLQLSMAGSREQDINAARQALMDAQADLEQKKKDFERYDTLYREDEISAQTRDQAKTNLDRAQAIYERQQQILNMLLEGTRKEQIAVDRANLHQAHETLGMSRIRLGYTRLLSPLAGVVLVRQAELGEVVTPGAPVFTVADLDHIWVRVYLPETDLGRVKWGQSVDVRTDTYPGKSYQGRVAFISSEAEFTPKSVQTTKERVTLVYRIKVDVQNPNHELKPGMPADVYIRTQ
jgi:HlyD family secretion protein